MRQTDGRIIRRLSARGISVFWSQFGGWKTGEKSRDDDAQRGMADLADLEASTLDVYIDGVLVEPGPNCRRSPEGF
jgi:hypothetical protein